MNKIFLTMLLFISSVFAEVINEYPSQKLLDSNIKIIDIRTKSEWKESGLLRDAITITFFDERGDYNVPVFMTELRKHIKDGEKFALICHVGSRTAMLADFLATEYKMKVVNLQGGMVYAKDKGLKILPYKH